MKFFASKRYQRVTNFALAFMLVVSTLTASVPFLFSESVSAVASNVYSGINLDGWTVDRTAPSGGSGKATFMGREALQLNVSQLSSNPDNFNRYEGLVKNITASNSIKGDLYVDAGWPSSVRAGIWGGGYDASNNVSSYPIIEFNRSVASNWRIFDSNGAGWRDVVVTSATTGWNKIELTINKDDSAKTDIYVNDVFVGSSIGESTQSFKKIYINNFNAGDANYAVRWSNFQYGNVPTNYSNVYVSPTGSDSNNGVSVDFPFKTVQKALNTVAVNGTVNLSAGTFPQEQLTIVKEGTKIIGQGRDATKVTVLSNGSGQGLLAEGLSNITIKSLGVVGSNNSTTASGNALVKLANGQNGIIENVQVESASGVRTYATGIDINGYANVRIDNVYIHGLGKNGIAVTGRSAGQSNDVNNIRIQGAAVADVSWAAIAFYTTKEVRVGGVVTDRIPLGNITNVSFGGTSTLQYNDDGVYLEGLTGKTITGLSGAPVSLDGVVLKDSRSTYITNAQSSDVNAYNVAFDGKTAGQMTSAEFAALNVKIIDRNDNPAAGIVNLRTALNAPVVQTQGWTNAATTVNWTAATDRTATNLQYAFSYSTDRYTGFTTVANGNSTSKDVSALFTTPGSYFVYVTATEDGVTTTSSTVEIQVIGTLEITAITGSGQAGSQATVNWTPVYGREQFDNYEVYLNDELVETVTDPSATSAEITLPNEVGPADVYVKANFKASIGGSNSRTSETETVEVVAVPFVPITPVVTIPASGDDDTDDDNTSNTQNAGFAGVIGATSNQGVLGANTDDDAAAAEVKGTSTDKTAAVADGVNNTDGKIFGLAWFWWLLIIAALAAIAWWIIGAIRRRNSSEA